MLDVRIQGADDGNVSRVTKRGELIVGSLDYSEPYYRELPQKDFIYNIVPAVVNQQFVITGIIVSSAKNVSADTVVDIFQSRTENGAIEFPLFTFTILKNTTIPISGLRVITKTTRWINVSADDRTINITILGYYVSA